MSGEYYRNMYNYLRETYKIASLSSILHLWILTFPRPKTTLGVNRLIISILSYLCSFRFHPPLQRKVGKYQLVLSTNPEKADLSFCIILCLLLLHFCWQEKIILWKGMTTKTTSSYMCIYTYIFIYLFIYL